MNAKRLFKKMLKKTIVVCAIAGGLIGAVVLISFSPTLSQLPSTASASPTTLSLSVYNAVAIVTGLVTGVSGILVMVGYIVRLTNVINSLRTDLLTQIHQNHEEITELKSLMTINNLNSEREIELLKKDKIRDYVELTRRISNLERFEQGKHGFQPRNENQE